MEDIEHYDICAFTLKPRIVDPLVLMNDGSVLRCSEPVPDAKRMHHEVARKGYSRSLY